MWRFQYSKWWLQAAGNMIDWRYLGEDLFQIAVGIVGLFIFLRLLHVWPDILAQLIL